MRTNFTSWFQSVKCAGPAPERTIDIGLARLQIRAVRTQMRCGTFRSKRRHRETANDQRRKAAGRAAAGTDTGVGTVRERPVREPERPRAGPRGGEAADPRRVLLSARPARAGSPVARRETSGGMANTPVDGLSGDLARPQHGAAGAGRAQAADGPRVRGSCVAGGVRWPQALPSRARWPGRAAGAGRGLAFA